MSHPALCNYWAAKVLDDIFKRASVKTTHLSAESQGFMNRNFVVENVLQSSAISGFYFHGSFYLFPTVKVFHKHLPIICLQVDVDEI